jgi:hypothetical protein
MEVAALVEEQWVRSKNVNRQSENAEIEAAVRQQLTGAHPAVEASDPQRGEVHESYEGGGLQSFFANLFKVRYEENGVVTYRKHWYRLVTKIFEPLAGILVGFVIWLLRLYDVFTLFPVGTTFLVVILFWIICLLWGIYEFIDWRNDIYQVTEDQIVDVYKKPLGSEDRKTAPLENILSIEYQRKGIISLILNYGSVVITVGTEKFTFDDVYSPSDVQQDIFRRMKQREQVNKQTHLKDERSRMSEWLAAYHKYSRDLPDGQENELQR